MTDADRERAGKILFAARTAGAGMNPTELGLRLNFLEAWLTGSDYTFAQSMLADWLEEDGRAEYRPARCEITDGNGLYGDVTVRGVHHSNIHVWRGREGRTYRPRYWPSPAMRQSRNWFLGFPPMRCRLYGTYARPSLVGTLLLSTNQIAPEYGPPVERAVGPAGFSALWWPKGSRFDAAGRVVSTEPLPDLFTPATNSE